MGPIFNENFDKKWNLWVREQCTDVLFIEDHVPYMNSAACWGKGVKKKKKRENAGNLKRNKRNVDPNSTLVMKFLSLKQFFVTIFVTKKIRH